MWNRLRNRQAGGFKFRRQQALGYFFADFFCAKAKLVFELDGTGHETQREYDAARTRWLEEGQLAVLRFSNAEVLSAPDRAVTQVGATQVTAPPKADSAKADAARADAARAETGSGRGDPDKPAKPAGPVQVTVVPGVARYHRSECILIRFLGEGDLETMSKQEAVAAGLTACRACQPDQLPDG